MQITPQNLAFLQYQFSAQYQKAFDGAPTQWQEYCTLMPSTTKTNYYGWLNQLAAMEEWTGTSTEDNVVANSYNLTNKVYQKIVSLSLDDLEDDQVGLYSPVIDNMGLLGKQWPDQVMAATVQAGTSALAFDGQTFFDTDHPVDLDDASKGTYSNNLVGAAYNFAADPVGAFALAKAQLGSFKDAGLNPLGLRATHVMCGPSMEKYVLQAVQATVVPYVQKNVAGAENVGAAGVTGVFAGTAKPLINDRITTNDVFVCDLSRAVKPFVWQLRKAAMFSALTAPTDQNIFVERKVKYKVDGRGAGGYSFPFLAVRCAAQ